jgi:putative toxin-antitoxin system antitoxin component (TIGR02293 family)
MKPSSQRPAPRPKKAGAPVAAAATRTGNTSTAYGPIHVLPGKKTARAKAPSGAKPARQPGAFVALKGSNVMAHDAVMKGVSGRVLAYLWDNAKAALPADAVLKAIGVSARTAHRIKTEPDKLLDARTTDGIYRLESVRAMAAEVLGSEEAANEWLNTEAMGLEFRRPIDLMSTSPGAEAVKTLLQRMKYGVYA